MTMHHISSRQLATQLSLEAQLFEGAQSSKRAVAIEKELELLFQRFFDDQNALVFKELKTFSYWYPEFLAVHKQKILGFIYSQHDHRTKWKLAQIVPFLSLTDDELNKLKNHFSYWALNPNSRRSVRVNALQALHDLALSYVQVQQDFLNVLERMKSVKGTLIEARVKALASINCNESKTSH